MHDASMNLMIGFVQKYMGDRSMSVLDIGSMNVHGCYQPIFNGHHLYVGLDMKPGPNVTIVSNELYSYPIDDNRFDVVISGQVIEHVQDLHRWIREVVRVTKDNGLVCIIGPNSWVEHRFPVDCWRILPDGLSWLMKDIGGLDVLECYSVGNDTIGIGRK